tara:strand:+ start:309 stop:557 length:249 start_codon:yes stop_codon:yes gene_type:complete
MERINLDGLEEAIKTAGDLLSEVKQASSLLNSTFDRAAAQAESPETVELLQSKVNRLVNKAMKGQDVTTEINKIKDEFKNIK